MEPAERVFGWTACWHGPICCASGGCCVLHGCGHNLWASSYVPLPRCHMSIPGCLPALLACWEVSVCTLHREPFLVLASSRLNLISGLFIHSSLSFLLSCRAQCSTERCGSVGQYSCAAATTRGDALLETLLTAREHVSDQGNSPFGRASL